MPWLLSRRSLIESVGALALAGAYQPAQRVAAQPTSLTPDIPLLHKERTMRQTYKIGRDAYVLPSDLPIPGVGQQPVNAFLFRDSEPILVDTGMPIDRLEFLEALWGLIDPADLRWVVITHDDRDHTGALVDILDAAPHARLVTNGVSLIRLSEEFAIRADRVVQVNPAERLRLGRRAFEVIRPPTFDSPGTIGLFDHTESTLISSDSFGTILPEPAEVLDITDRAFREGFDVFNRAIAPWTAATDLPRFNAVLRRIQRLAPSTVLSTHAPVINRHVGALFDAMSEIPLLPAWLPGSTLDAGTGLALRHDELALAEEAF
jgi:glyoxylase-like metal-dependent hydrolase (beta-lactamase superfamily II)